MKKFTVLQKISFILALSIIVLFIPHLVRLISYDSALIGQEPYYHARMAEYIYNNGIPKEDPITNTPYLLNPSHLLLAYSADVFDIETLSKIYPFLFGILSVILLYFLLMNFDINGTKSFLISLIFILSPIFIYTFTVSTHYSLSIFLFFFGFYLYIKKSKLSIISIIPFMILVFFTPINTFLIVFLLLSYYFLNRQTKKQFYLFSTLLILISLFYYLPIYFEYGILSEGNIIHTNFITEFVSDFGAQIGFGIFNILLMLFGFVTTWKKRKEYYLFYPFILIVLIISLFYNSELNIYLNIAFSIFAAFGLYFIINMKWSLEIIKTITVWVILCGLVFSSASYINRLSNSGPDIEVVESLKWMKDNTNPDSIVFSHYSKGFWIEHIAQRKVILDGNLYSTDYIQETWNQSQEIFYSRNLVKTTEILNNYNISYIWIDEDMKEGQVWVRDKQGLLFLFRNNETFKKTYNHTSIGIWEFLKKE